MSINASRIGSSVEMPVVTVPMAVPGQIWASTSSLCLLTEMKSSGAWIGH
jgi:hypothetical protein